MSSHNPLARLIWQTSGFLTFSALILFSPLGFATTITSSLGNTASGFADGSAPLVFQVGGAQGGQPVPFDQGYGTDGLFGGNFDQTWTHNFAPIAEDIVSASLTIGIYDHDSSASGSQVGGFSYDGNSLTPTLDGLFEAGGGSGDGVFNIYTVVLTDFAALADGSVTIALDLMGPGLVPDLFGGGFAETTTNGANLIFSTLTVTTVPIPAALPLFLTALFGLGVIRRRRRLNPGVS